MIRYTNPLTHSTINVAQLGTGFKFTYDPPASDAGRILTFVRDNLCTGIGAPCSTDHSNNDVQGRVDRNDQSHSVAVVAGRGQRRVGHRDVVGNRDRCGRCRDCEVVRGQRRTSLRQ